MSKKENLIEEFKRAKTFDYRKFVTMMIGLGYEKIESAGSRVIFSNKKTGHVVHMHSPHPEKDMSRGAVTNIRKNLIENGVI